MTMQARTIGELQIPESNEAREKVLLIGDSGTSKTRALVTLAMIYPDRTVVIFDPDDGTGKALKEFGLRKQDLPNLLIYPVKTDWDEMLTFYNQIKALLRPNDWLCLDMIGRFWDLVQQYYSIRVFGHNPIEHLLSLRAQAIKPGFGGFDGLQDWSLIKRMHNELLMDDAVLYQHFNVMATTSAGKYMAMETLPAEGVLGILARNYGVKPEGEKHNVYRFDTVALMFRDRANGAYMFRLVKDRGRVVDHTQAWSIQDSAFWSVYKDMRGLA